MYIALKLNLTTNLIMKTFLVNYHLPKGEGASCFSDSATAPSPQALIPTIPAVFLILMNANFLLFRWKNPISKSSNHNANIQLYF